MHYWWSVGGKETKKGTKIQVWEGKRWILSFDWKKNVKNNGSLARTSWSQWVCPWCFPVWQMPNNCKIPKCSLYFTKIKSGIAIVSLICRGSLAHSVCHISQWWLASWWRRFLYKTLSRILRCEIWLLSKTGKPRSSNAMIPTVNFLNRSVFVPFDVTAYPVPNILTFAFLGASAANISTPQTDYDGITLMGFCRQKGDKLYISVCIVTVDNMTSSAAAGFYQVAVANGQGQALFTVQIKYNGQYIIYVISLGCQILYSSQQTERSLFQCTAVFWYVRR